MNDVICEGWPQHRVLRPLLFSNSGGGSFTSHKNQISVSAVRRDLRFSSLSEKIRKSNRSQMSLQRQHFLLSYLKTLSVGPARDRTRDLPLSRPALSQLSRTGDAHQPEVSPSLFSYALTITNLYCKVCFLLWRRFTREFLVTKPLPNDAKSPLPVDVRRSKTLLLKLPNTCSYN